MGIFDRLKKKSGAWQKASETSAAVSDATEKVKIKETTVRAKTSERKSPISGGGDGKRSVLAHHILVKPLVSERAAIAESLGTYTFVVAKHATKATVREAIREAYGVVPTRIRMMNVQGKPRQYGRFKSNRSDWKKAMVVLKKGDVIKIHEGV